MPPRTRAFPTTPVGQLHRRRKLKESVSEGASGSFFFRVMSEGASRASSSHISRAEKQTLMYILLAYELHVTRARWPLAHPVPRLPLDVAALEVLRQGLLRRDAQLPAGPAVAHLRPAMGATANRRGGALPPPGALRGAAGRRRRGVRNAARLGVLRRGDGGRRGRERAKAELAEEIAADAAFLSSQGRRLLLLVGIHRLAPQLAPAEREERLRSLEAQGGYASLDRQKVYFFGIIDVLERYALRWQVQHAAFHGGLLRAAQGRRRRGHLGDAAALEHAERFETFVLHEVLQVLALAAADSRAAAASARAASRAASGGATAAAAAG